MSFEGKISGSLAPQGAKVGNLSGSIGAVVPDIRDESVTTAKLADAAVTIAKLAQDVTALINSKGSASDVAQLQEDVAALQTITEGLGTASTYGVANNLTQAAAGANVLDAYQGKLLGDRMTTAEGDIDTLNDGYANLGGVKIVTFSTQVSIPSGISAPVNYDVSYASVSPGSGYRLESVMCRMGLYVIPYIASDLKTATWVYQINDRDKTFTITNTATAWGSYELTAILFFKPV